MSRWPIDVFTLVLNRRANRNKDTINSLRCAALKERCPPRQKSRVERLKAKVEPLLT